MSKIFFIHADKSAAGKKDLYSEFLPKGFIASRHATYAPDCDSCNSCVPLRIRTDDYSFSKNEKAIIRHNNALSFHYTPPGRSSTLSQEHLALFRHYERLRHPVYGMENWDDIEIKNDLEGHSGQLDIRDNGGTLIASVVFNYLDQGLAPHYIFFDPEKSGNRASLGTLCILKMIEHARTANPGPVYLGHWVKGAERLEYKKRFRNLEALTNKGWQDFDPATHVTGPDYKKAVPQNADQFHIK